MPAKFESTVGQSINTRVSPIASPQGDINMRHIILSAAVVLTGFAAALAQASTVDDEREIRAAVDAYIAAFNKGDFDGVLAYLAADADLIDETGKQYKGKASLAEVIKRSLVDLKGNKLTVTITSLRFLRPEVALIDGKASLTAPDGAIASDNFTAVWTKTGGKWLLGSVRDLPGSSTTSESSAEPLRQLEWLVGDWVHEAPN